MQANTSDTTFATATEAQAGLTSWNVGTDTREVLLTTATSAAYFEKFRAYSLPYWIEYAKANRLGIIAIVGDSHLRQLPEGMNGAWLKLLAPDIAVTHFPQLSRFALIDTDVIINPTAPNLFDSCPADQIGVVSQIKNLPFDLMTARKRVAFLRRANNTTDNPQNYSLFASAQQEYEMEGYTPFDDFFCSGLIVLGIQHVHLFRAWLEEADSHRAAKAVAWEQTFLNSKVLTHGCFWMPYDFQSIWNLEMAMFHPSLYRKKTLADSEEAAVGIADTLINRHFLHFAGSWSESKAWENSPESVRRKLGVLVGDPFREYLDTEPTGLPVGRIAEGS